MATGPAGARTFVDTEVLVFAHQRRDDQRRHVAAGLLAHLWRQRTGAVSAQVLQEFYFVATERAEPRLSRSLARSLVAAYGAWPTIATDAVLIAGASELAGHHGVEFRDALVIEAARRVGAGRIVTSGMHGRRAVAGVRIENPFE
jgi:predicted nucleic acid-binding protein